jgi:tetratricopeptide (TPR) repeat protein
VGRDDWYTTADWDADARELFESKLARARERRWGYARVKGQCLLEAGNTEAGRKLLHRVLDEGGDDEMAVSFAHELLADSYHDERRAIEAEAHYRAALAFDDRGHTSGPVIRLYLARLILDTNQTDRYGEAAELLDDEELKNNLYFRVQQFQYAATQARLADGLGMSDEAAPWARQALRLADLDQRGLSCCGARTVEST